MTRLCKKTGLVPNLLLAGLLIAAQSAIAVHAFEHENGTLQKTTCTTCVAASQLASACVDSSVAVAISPFVSLRHTESVSAADTIHTLVIRQRGPPASI